jgi:hypothetical protein
MHSNNVTKEASMAGNNHASALRDALETVVRQCGDRLTEASGNSALLPHIQSLLAEPTLEDAYAEGRRDEQEELATVLPGTTYMDPPDGGAPTILEQLRRQAKDAARWCMLPAFIEEHQIDYVRLCRQIDAAIDGVARHVEAQEPERDFLNAGWPRVAADRDVVRVDAAAQVTRGWELYGRCVRPGLSAPEQAAAESALLAFFRDVCGVPAVSRPADPQGNEGAK